MIILFALIKDLIFSKLNNRLSKINRKHNKFGRKTPEIKDGKNRIMKIKLK